MAPCQILMVEAKNHPPRLRAIMKAAPDILTKPFGYCPHTGYQRISSSGTLLIMDTGGTPPGPFDSHAHLAPGSFELSTKSRTSGCKLWLE